MPDEYIVRKGDLLIGMDGNFRCCEWSGPDAGLNQRVCKIAPNPAVILPRFLLYGLNGYLDAIRSATSSVTVGHLSSRDIQRIPFPAPPLGEQARIVARLDRILGLLAPSQGRLSQARALLKRFRQAALVSACSGRLTSDWRAERGLDPEEPNWKTLKAADACSLVQSGSTPSADRFKKVGPIPFLKVYNIVNQKIDFESRSQFVETSTHNSQLRKSIVKPGDVLMNIVGPPLGKVALVPETFKEWNINQAIVLFRPKSDVLPAFLYYLLCSGIPYREILQETRGSAGQSNISLTQCREMMLAVPSVPEQREIVRRTAKMVAMADSLLSRIERTQVEVDGIRPALLAKALRGELCAQVCAHSPSASV